MSYDRGCARCDWTVEADTRPEARTSAEGHARRAGHPLCQLCGRSLPDALDRTCYGCAHRAKVRLADVVDLYALLPGELANLGGPRSLLEAAALDEPAASIDALVMLAPGSNGNVQRVDDHEPRPVLGYPFGAPGRRRLPRRYDAYFTRPIEVGNLNQLPDEAVWVPVDDESPWQSQAHGLNLLSDPESIATRLGAWEDDWRSLRAEAPAMGEATVMGAASYLAPKIGWAAETHPAFADFVDDLRRLHRDLEDATSSGDRPERSDAPCFECGQADLERAYRPPDACDHAPPPRLLLGYSTPGGEPLTSYDEPPGSYRQREIRWRNLHECDQGGRTTVWTCRSCGREYEPKEYWLAVRALLEAQAIVDDHENQETAL